MVCHASGDPPFLAPLFISATFGASDRTHCGDPLISIPWCDTRYRSTFPILFTGHTRSFSLFHVRSPMSIMRKLPYVISRPTDWAFSDGSASCIREHTGVDDAHVHAGGDGVIKEGGVHGLADLVVAAEAKRYIGNAATDLSVGQIGFDPARSVDKVDGVVVVLFHARRDGEDVGIEDDVFGRETYFADKNIVGAFADADSVFVGGGLA